MKTPLALAGSLGAGALTLGGALWAGGGVSQPATWLMVVTGAALGWSLVSLHGFAVAMSGHGGDARIDARPSTRLLQQERARLLRAIKELDFDFGLGKLTPRDHRAVRADYEARVLELQRLLKLEQAPHPALAGLLADDPAPGAVSGAASGAGVRCAGCGANNDADARFCKGCGGAL